MADQPIGIFNRKATEKLRSPDDLDKYVRVTNPSVWAVLGACAALLLGLLAWGVFGAVSTSVSATGVAVGNDVMCFLDADDVAKVNVGDGANVNGQRMTVASVAAVPLSHDEARDVLNSDYLVETLLEADWAYQVVFDGDGSSLAQGVPLTVQITTQRIAPIALIIGE